MIRAFLFIILISLGFIALAQKPDASPAANGAVSGTQPQQGQSPAPGAPAVPGTPAGNQGNPTLGEQLVRRDPFKGPQYLINKIRAATASANPPPARGIDDRVDAIMRWPLVEYNLVGIMWDVKSPKALFKDPQNKIHVLKVHDKISSDEAQIRKIREGTLVVDVRGVQQIIRIKKR